MRPHRPRNELHALAVVFLGSLVAAASEAAPLAVIAAVQGPVAVSTARPHGETRAVFGQALAQGDRVAVGPGGKVTLLFEDGRIVELPERNALTIGARPAATARAASVPGDVFAGVSRFATAGSRQKGLVAMAEMRGEPDAGSPMILSPRQTWLLSETPAFRWRAVEGAERYRVRVSVGGHELWDREMPAATVGPEATLAYPSDAAVLGEGVDVQWVVEAIDAKGTLRRESTSIRVLQGPARDSVRANLVRIQDGAGGPGAVATRFLAGSYLSGMGLLMDAAEEFRSLVELVPDAADPHEALGNTYLDVGLVDLAANEYRRALALQRDAR